jgi:hypothetical protein
MAWLERQAEVAENLVAGRKRTPEDGLGHDTALPSEAVREAWTSRPMLAAHSDQAGARPPTDEDSGVASCCEVILSGPSSLLVTRSFSW